jgi:hypothetical protein
MIPLASDLLPFPGQMRREGHLKSAGLPDRLSSSGRITILGTTLRICLEVIAVPVDKIAWRCKQATESAGVSWALDRRGCRLVSFRTREEFVPQCSESCRRARRGEPRAVIRLMR